MFGGVCVSVMTSSDVYSCVFVCVGVGVADCTRDICVCVFVCVGSSCVAIRVDVMRDGVVVVSACVVCCCLAMPCIIASACC